MKQKPLPNFYTPVDTRAKLPKDYRKLAKSRGFIWLELPVRTAIIKTAWACSKGHVWRAAYNTIQQGSGCPYCANKAPKTDVDYRLLAEAKSIEWIGTLPKTTDDKTLWRCFECLNEWESTYQNIYNGAGCLKCRQKQIADDLRLSPSDYEQIGLEKSIIWIGEYVLTANDKTLWKCLKCNNEWMTSYTSIRTCNSCPNCLDFVNGNRVSQQQRTIADMLNGEINAKLGRKYIDITIIREGIKIAVEYDSWYWHGFRLEEDEKRDRILIKAGYRIIHIRSNTQLPTIEQLNNAIANVLKSGKTQIITLPDWGIGKVFRDDTKQK